MDNNLKLNPEYEKQAQRLSQFRQVAADSLKDLSTPVNAGIQRTSSKDKNELAVAAQNAQNERHSDPLIYPGLYSPSGFDMLSILMRVVTRPNPVYKLGSIDSAVALVLVDAQCPGETIVYCSEPFESLTGYNSSEIMSRNCRFLQSVPDALTAEFDVDNVAMANRSARTEIKKSIDEFKEAQVLLLNFKKNGVMFLNLLTIIPLIWEASPSDSNPTETGQPHRYFVGFQVDATDFHRSDDSMNLLRLKKKTAPVTQI